MASAYPQNAYLNNPYMNPGFGNQFGNAQWFPSAPMPQTQGQQMPPQTQNAPQQGGLRTIDAVFWIQGGEGSAKAFTVPAGKTYMLIDSETDKFYIKTSDPYGRPLPLNAFRYSADEPEPEVNVSSFVTREEFDELKKKFDGLAVTSTAKDDEEVE